MKNRLIYALLAFAALAFTYGCSSDDYLREGEIQKMIDNSLNGQWKVVNISVKKEQWKWSDEFKQYEVVFNLPELKKPIYEEGAILGYIFLGGQGKTEVQKALPYVNTYSAGEDPVTHKPIIFTETISYDVEYRDNSKSTVAFFIKDSQLAKDENAPQNYNFRIVLIW